VTRIICKLRVTQLIEDEDRSTVEL